LFVAVVAGAGCTYHRAYLDYEAFTARLPVQAGAVTGERLGVVRAAEGGPIWRECTDVARGSLWVLIENARALGANAIGDVAWYPVKAEIDHRVPQCKQKWGWFLVWPVLLTPGFQSAIVEGTAYRVATEAPPRAGVYLIPAAAEARRALAARIEADLTAGAIPAGD
jgi:hypothetical protein